jgi:hypothetical protein
MTAALRVKHGQGRSLGAVDALDFVLPEELVAREPPEARGLARDGVRLLVSDPDTDDVRHATARDLPDFLDDGDVLVVNASATINAALDGWRSERGGATEELVALHLSSPVPWSDDEHRWIVELRRLTADGTRPLLDARAGERIRLRGGGSATLVAPFGDRASGLPNGPSASGKPTSPVLAASWRTRRSSARRSGTATCASDGRSMYQTMFGIGLAAPRCRRRVGRSRRMSSCASNRRAS